MGQPRKEISELVQKFRGRSIKVTAAYYENQMPTVTNQVPTLTDSMPTVTDPMPTITSLKEQGLWTHTSGCS